MQLLMILRLIKRIRLWSSLLSRQSTLQWRRCSSLGKNYSWPLIKIPMFFTFCSCCCKLFFFFFLNMRSLQYFWIHVWINPSVNDHFHCWCLVKGMSCVSGVEPQNWQNIVKKYLTTQKWVKTSLIKNVIYSLITYQLWSYIVKTCLNVLYLSVMSSFYFWTYFLLFLFKYWSRRLYPAKHLHKYRELNFVFPFHISYLRSKLFFF